MIPRPPAKKKKKKQMTAHCVRKSYERIGRRRLVGVVVVVLFVVVIVLVVNVVSSLKVPVSVDAVVNSVIVFVDAIQGVVNQGLTPIIPYLPISSLFPFSSFHLLFSFLFSRPM